MTKDEIKELLFKIQITDMQFDLNGVCNAGCWFCPVAYEIAPKRQNMDIRHVEQILNDVLSEKGRLVSENFKHIYTAHYNEILLYPDYEAFLVLLEERVLTTMVLTNGIALTPKMTDILVRHEKAISGINFNIPAIEKEEWKKQAGFKSDRMYDRLIENITYLLEKMPERTANGNISVGMNGIIANSFFEVGGWIEKGSNMDVANDVLAQQHALFKQKFPGLHIYMNPSIVDRDHLLEKNGIISLSRATDVYNKKGKEVIGCRNGSMSFEREKLTGRPFGWIHISSLGDLFLCCQDFHIKSKFGNIIERPLREIWLDDKHVDLIYDSFNGVCKECNYAQWG